MQVDADSNWQPIELIYFQSSLSFLPASTGASCANLVNWISTEHINELITIIVATILNRAKVVCPLKLASRCDHDHDDRDDRATHASAHSPSLSRVLPLARSLFLSLCRSANYRHGLPLAAAEDASATAAATARKIFRPTFWWALPNHMKYEVKSSNKFRAFKQQ